MRLTLRTLLAYLDDILDPADSRELGRKIEESEFASGLVHRIRSVTRKLRLGAPKMAGKGMGLDANTVAEYLDNTLPQDRVPDFEKVCLESDVQLAEVASCHQILTLVLGEPADVEPALREQMRSLLDRVEGTVGVAGVDATRTAAALLPHPPRSPDDADSQVPVTPAASVEVSAVPNDTQDRLGIPLLPVVGTLAATFLIALGVLVALGPLDDRHPLLGRLLGKRVAVSTDGSPGQPSGPIERAVPAGSEETPRTESAGPAASPAPPGDEPSRPTRPQGTSEPAAANEPPALEPDSESVPKLPPLPTAEPPADMAAEAKPPAAEGVTALTDPRLDRSKLPPEEEDGEPAAPPEPLASFTSDQHVLARFDAETGTWLRAVPHESLTAEARLIALPTYRPQILFSAGIQIVAVGPAELELLEGNADGVPGVKLHAGRLLAMSTGKPRSRLRIQWGPHEGFVTFDDLDSTLALDAWRYLAPGLDPETQSAQDVVEMFSVAGSVTWRAQGATEEVVLEPDKMTRMVDAGSALLQPLAEQPDWLDTRSEPLINQTASRELERLLEPAQPLLDALRQQVGNRQIEVRSLAARSLMLFDEFEPFVGAINSPESRYYWKDLVESARTAIARSPASAAQVLASFTRVRGEDGSQLYRLLGGFNPEQLADGGAQFLVTSLSSAATDMRVLAYLNLQQITGKTNNYQPDREPRTQRRSIMNWERDLQQRQIFYKSPPTGPAGAAATPSEVGAPEGQVHNP